MTRPSAESAADLPASRPRREPWRCTVRNLGPIGEVEIEVRPITLLVGENNSGKTWLATVLWALHSDRFGACFESPGDANWDAAAAAMLAAFQTVRPSLGLDDAGKGRTGATAVVPASAAQGEVAGDWSQWAAALKTNAVARLVMAYLPGVQGSVSVEIPVRLGQVGWTAATWNPLGAAGPTLALTRVRLGEHAASRAGWGLVPDNHPAAVQFAAAAAGEAMAMLSGAPTMDRPFLSGAGYLPASRTGLIQLLPMVAQESTRALSRIDPLRQGTGAPSDSKGPVVPGIPPAAGWLVERLLSAHVFDESYGDLARVLENEVLRGQVQAQPNQPSNFQFRPDGTDVEVPMSSASSVVTEVFPFIHLLRTGNIPAFLVFEEPEAHLHPHVQRKLARVLVRLANRGVKLLISTHSDIFAQQINNCIKLGAAKARLSAEAFSRLLADLNCGDEEVLAEEDVAAYGFARLLDSGRTRVDRLAVSAAGVAMPSFNDELAHLNSDMDLLDAALEVGL